MTKSSIVAYNNKGILHTIVTDTKAIQNHVFVSMMTNPAWHPNGKKIAFGYLKLHILDLPSQQLISLIDDPIKQWDPSWTFDTKRIVFVNRGGHGGLYQVELENRQYSLFHNSNNGTVHNPSCHPQKLQVVFANENHEVSGQTHIEIAEATSDWQVDKVWTITSGEHKNDRPAWHPSGEQIAFTSNRTREWNIYTMNADGSNQQRITNNPHGDFNPCWSPDGQYIAFDRKDEHGQYNIFIMRPDGSDIQQLTTDGGREPDWWMPLP